MNIIKYLGWGILSLVLFIVITTVLVIILIPAFGQKPSVEDQANYLQSNQFENGLFVNNIPTTMEMSWKTTRSVLSDYINGIPDQKPKQPLPVLHPKISQYREISDSITQLIWFGHSAFLLQMEGKNILLDPMLGPSPSPLPFLGSDRFTEGLPIAIDSLPSIDVVVFSHDHYDHLDYHTLKKLKGKIKSIVVPLGVESHLKTWGIDTALIHPLDWHEYKIIDKLKFTCTPARHFSGRGLTDRNATLWSSWVITGQNSNLYFSGDGGYGPHFKEIGNKYGPFDLALLECGQYDPRWSQIHMMPEETVAAAQDVNTKVFMPIHWGAFVLALHSWYDPIERVQASARQHTMPIVTPQIGEIVKIPSEKSLNTEWWKAYQ